MRFAALTICTLFASCLPTKSETVTCQTDEDCTSVQAGFKCDVRRRVCVCDATARSPGCADAADGGIKFDSQPVVPIDAALEVSPTDSNSVDATPVDVGSVDVAKPECEISADCPATTPLCSPGGLCRTCATAVQCAILTDPARTACSPSGACVQCIDDTTCSTVTPVCNKAISRCVQCVTHSSCPPNVPICSDSNGTCVACATSGQCAARDAAFPACSAAGTCVQCNDSTNCSGTNSVCDVSLSKCVQCLASSSCAGTTPVCSMSSHTCIGCGAKADCTAADPNHRACSGTGACVECIDNSTCSDPAPVCNMATSTCVECLTSANCAGVTPICNTAKHICAACGTAAECQQADPRRAACSMTGQCVECIDNSTCAGARPLCDTSTGRCAQCLTHASCSGATPICSSIGRSCTGCATAVECAAADPEHPACAANGACVQCTDNATCSGNTPICNLATNTCRACGSDSECTAAPGVCMSHQDGRCASTGETLVVASTGALPASTVPAGIRVVLIKGNVSGTVAWALPDSPQITLVGQNAGTLTGRSSTPTLHVTGGDLYVRGLTVTAGSPGIVADGGAILRLDHVSVTNNSAGGIILDGAAFDIRNTIVTNNGANIATSPFGGILLLNTPSSSGLPKSIVLSSVLSNQLVGIVCANGPGALSSPTPTSILVASNIGGDISGTCDFSSCGAASPTCGAQP